MGEVWNFDKQDDFEDHIRSSIPCYNEIHYLASELVRSFGRPRMKVIDIGCSTGSLLFALEKQLGIIYDDSELVELVGLDISEKFIIQNKSRAESSRSKIKFLCESAENLDKISEENFDVILSLFTLQFLHRSLRAQILMLIYEKLAPGGGFVVFEKVFSSSGEEQSLLSDIYMKFKKDSGFTADEIFNKTQSIRGVMRSDSTTGLLDAISAAGFSKIFPVFQYLHFRGWVCLKD